MDLGKLGLVSKVRQAGYSMSCFGLFRSEVHFKGATLHVPWTELGRSGPTQILDDRMHSDRAHLFPVLNPLQRLVPHPSFRPSEVWTA